MDVLRSKRPPILRIGYDAIDLLVSLLEPQLSQKMVGDRVPVHSNLLIDDLHLHSYT